MKVRANADVVIRIGGMPRAVREGQAFDEKDAVVRDYPWLFEAPVEQATANPGQRRTTRRREA